MMLTMLKAKLHRAKVTDADLEYEGSIGVSEDLLKAAGILQNEQVDVYNISNGQRFTTYAIKLPAGTGQIVVNGAAARLVARGDLVIICAYAQYSEAEASAHVPTVVLLDNVNRVKSA